MFFIDICISDNIAEVDLFSIINDNLPLYKLRADTLFTHNNSDWVEAPLYVDEDSIGELTNEQIKHTLDYFSKFLLLLLIINSDYLITLFMFVCVCICVFVELDFLEIEIS